MTINEIEFIFFIIVMTALGAVTTFKFKPGNNLTARNSVNVILCTIIGLIGDYIAVGTESESVFRAGYSIFLIGSLLMSFSLVLFTLDYCGFSFRKRFVYKILLFVVFADFSNIISGIFLKHTFGLEKMSDRDVTGIRFISAANFSLIHHTGIRIHAIIVVLLMIIVYSALILKCIRSSRVYYSKYISILIILVVSGLWEMFQFLSTRTVDKSMIGFSVGAALIFYLSLIARPKTIRRILSDRVVSNMEDAILYFDVDGNAIFANGAMYELLSIELNDRRPAACEERLDEICEANGITRHIDVNSPYDSEMNRDYKSEISTIDKNGSKRYVDLNYIVMRDAKGIPIGSFYYIHEKTKEVIKNERRKYLATHDTLTGLYNRARFCEVVDEMIRTSPDQNYTMILSDVKDFKLINEIYGPDIGDNVLTVIGNAIERFAHKDSVYCRWGADRFAAFARSEDINPYDIDRLVRHEMSRDKSMKFPPVIHLGFCIEKGETVNASSLVDRCLIAINTIKNDFNNRVSIYDEELRSESLWQHKITSELDNAIKSGEIIPYIQPQYTAEGRLIGGEILVRWQHPTEGFLEPYRFIPIFEKNGRIAQLDSYMWRRACEILKSWEGTDKERLRLSVNISPKDFYFLDIYKTLTGLIEEYGLTPDKLHIEITETVVMSDAKNNIDIIEQLKEYGFTIEMDDFGSGYSSLNLLKNMPIDVLKVDMMFLGKSSDQKKAEIILHNVINMASDLSMPQIVEGVESKENFELLKAMGCKEFQGYYFSKPVSLEIFETLPENYIFR